MNVMRRLKSIASGRSSVSDPGGDSSIKRVKVEQEVESDVISELQSVEKREAVEVKQEHMDVTVTEMVASTSNTSSIVKPEKSDYDELPKEMHEMKIKEDKSEDKEMEAAVVNGNGTEKGQIIVTFVGGRNGQPFGGQQENEEEVEEVQEVPIRRRPTKAEKKTWTPVEEEALAKAWVHISTCRVVGNEQSREGFWRRIHEHFKHNVPDTARSHHGLNTKWKSMHTEMGVFNGLYIQQNRLRESGCSDVDVMKNALADYKTKTSKAFTHIDAWEIVRREDKWLEQPDVSQGSTSHSDKRRKSSESGHYETASTDNTVIPDLNDDTMPRIPKRKGKKAESESSTKGSVAASFDAYTSRKTQILETMAEKKAAKDEMAARVMETKIRVMEEKAMFRALKFFQQPHDNITDPNVLAITLAKKREIAEKYGWTFDF